MNAYQKICASTFAKGDYSWLIDDPAWQDHLDTMYDDLFVFLMRELSNEEACDSKKEAEMRLAAVIDDVTVVLSAVKTAVFITRSDDYV